MTDLIPRCSECNRRKRLWTNGMGTGIFYCPQHDEHPAPEAGE